MTEDEKPKVTRSSPRSVEKTTTAVNINKGIRCEVYVGRGTPFGNPYVIGQDGDRDEVIRKYQIHFYEKLKIDPNFKKQVQALKGRVLGCHCVPMRCHTEVLIEYLDVGPNPP